ncbi:MAG: general secretion pathway protein GspK [Acidobacteria bacterium]|nr:general secretion pathway protein GspK [Acidobacteriota bacterium]
MTARRHPTADESGVILIALLWILVALCIIALSFAKETFVEVAAARNSQALKESYFIARGGIAATVYRLMGKRAIPARRQAQLREEPDALDLGRVTGSLGGGFYTVDIQDESGKVNINAVSDLQLRALIQAAGIEQQDVDIIADSILDWRDPDKAHHLNGAEDDYYQTLDPPYYAKNGRFDTIEELLLVRGVTAEYFYGRPERAPDGSVTHRYGLSRYLTVYSSRNQVNVNHAPLAVLLSVPGMPPEAARLIYERRLLKPFESVAEITRDLPVNLGTTTTQFLSVDQTGVYALTVSAGTPNSKAVSVIRTVVSLEAGANTPYRTLYWNENVPDYEGMKP